LLSVLNDILNYQQGVLFLKMILTFKENNSSRIDVEKTQKELKNRKKGNQINENVRHQKNLVKFVSALKHELDSQK